MTDTWTERVAATGAVLALATLAAVWFARYLVPWVARRPPSLLFALGALATLADAGLLVALARRGRAGTWPRRLLGGGTLAGGLAAFPTVATLALSTGLPPVVPGLGVRADWLALVLAGALSVVATTTFTAAVLWTLWTELVVGPEGVVPAGGVARPYWIAGGSGALALAGIATTALVSEAYRSPRGGLFVAFVFTFFLLADVAVLVGAALASAIARWGRSRTWPLRLLAVGTLGGALAVLPTVVYQLSLWFPEAYWVDVVWGTAFVAAVGLRLVSLPVAAAGLVWYAGAAAVARLSS